MTKVSIQRETHKFYLFKYIIILYKDKLDHGISVKS